MRIDIRPENDGDAAQISKVTELAFRHAAHTCGREHWLVGELRHAGALTVSLVATAGLEIVGHVAASPVSVSTSSGDWFGIGPVSVLPEFQRRGIGSQLMHSALARLRGSGARGCVLVGDPGFYGRFGFVSSPRLIVPGVPPEVCLSLAFSPSDDCGTVAFHPAFTAAMSEPGPAPESASA